MNIMLALSEQKEVLELQGYKVAYICVYGSQNYNLDINNDDYKSDIDMKAIIVPTLDDLITNAKPVSIVVDTKWGQCDVKDIRSYFETLLKANPAYIETLYTKYYIIDNAFDKEFSEVRNLSNYLVHALRLQFIRAMYGMMCEKEKALCHPYPSIIHKIEKFGFDGKQAHHVKRLQLLMFDYFENNYELDVCLTPPDEEMNILFDLKLNKLTLEEAKAFVDKTMQQAKEFKDRIISETDEATINYSIKDKFLLLSQSIIKEKIVSDIID